MTRVLLYSGIALGIGVLGTLLWVDRLFEEPDAHHVQSLAGEFSAKSVVAVFAHPDDEQLVTGLLIRAKERDQAETRMITMTKGEAGTPLPQISRLKDLGVVRHAEVLKNSYALGVDEHQVWDVPDGGVTDADHAFLVEQVSQQLIAWQADFVVTFWPESGFSGHEDHKSVGRITTRAVELLNEEGQHQITLAYILAPGTMMRKFGGERGRLVVERQPLPTHAMSGESWAKIRGWDIHASQKGYVLKAYGMPPGLLHRLYDKEHYFVLPTTIEESYMEGDKWR